MDTAADGAAANTVGSESKEASRLLDSPPSRKGPKGPSADGLAPIDPVPPGSRAKTPGVSPKPTRPRAPLTKSRTKSAAAPQAEDSPRVAAPKSSGARSTAAWSIEGAVARYRTLHHPGVADEDWNDWKWQLRHRVRDLAGLQRAFRLSADELATVEKLGDRLPVGLTPYYAALIDPEDPLDPLRLTMLPVGGELVQGRGEEDDPLGEDHHMTVPGLVHRYPDRVLFLVSTFCATYCRYCTRARIVGKTGEYHFNTDHYQRAIDYIAQTPSVRDVLISGGDPLTMADDRLDWLLGSLRAIPHVEFVRIGSKVPAVLPQRITPELCAMLKRHQPWLSVHFMHPNELTPEVALALGRLADAGIPLGSQTVLVKDVNDDVETLKHLVHGLLKNRVRPYYLYQCDPISGSAHLRTPVERGVELIEGLRGHTTGYAVPTFVVDAPGGGGKIPLAPNYVVGREDDDLLLRNYSGAQFRYPDPLESSDSDA